MTDLLAARAQMAMSLDYIILRHRYSVPLLMVMQRDSGSSPLVKRRAYATIQSLSDLLFLDFSRISCKLKAIMKCFVIA